MLERDGLLSLCYAITIPLKLTPPKFAIEIPGSSATTVTALQPRNSASLSNSVIKAALA